MLFSTMAVDGFILMDFDWLLSDCIELTQTRVGHVHHNFTRICFQLVSLVELTEEDLPRTQMRPISCWAGSQAPGYRRCLRLRDDPSFF
jgi:hypothetical protein